MKSGKIRKKMKNGLENEHQRENAESTPGDRYSLSQKNLRPIWLAVWGSCDFSCLVFDTELSERLQRGVWDLVWENRTRSVMIKESRNQKLLQSQIPLILLKTSFERYFDCQQLFELTPLLSSKLKSALQNFSMMYLNNTSFLAETLIVHLTFRITLWAFLPWEMQKIYCF